MAETITDYLWNYFRESHTEQTRLAGTSGGHQVQHHSSEQGQAEQLLRAMSRQVLNIARDGDSIAPTRQVGVFDHPYSKRDFSAKENETLAQ